MSISRAKRLMYLTCFSNNWYDFHEQQLPTVACNGDIAWCPVKNWWNYASTHTCAFLTYVLVIYFIVADNLSIIWKNFKRIEFCSNTTGKNDPRHWKSPLGMRQQEAKEATTSLKPHWTFAGYSMCELYFTHFKVVHSLHIYIKVHRLLHQLNVQS